MRLFEGIFRKLPITEQNEPRSTDDGERSDTEVKSFKTRTPLPYSSPVFFVAFGIAAISPLAVGVSSSDVLTIVISGMALLPLSGVLLDKFLINQNGASANLYLRSYQVAGEVFAVMIGFWLSIVYSLLAAGCILTLCETFDDITGARFKRFSIESFHPLPWKKQLDFLSAGATLLISFMLAFKLEMIGTIRKFALILSTLILLILGLACGLHKSSLQGEPPDTGSNIVSVQEQDISSRVLPCGLLGWIILAHLTGKFKDLSGTTAPRNKLILRKSSLAIGMGILATFVSAAYFVTTFPVLPKVQRPLVVLFEEVGPRYAALPYALCTILLLSFAATDLCCVGVNHLETLVNDGLLFKFLVRDSLLRAYGASLSCITFFTAMCCLLCPLSLLAEVVSMLSIGVLVIVVNIVQYTLLAPSLNRFERNALSVLCYKKKYEQLSEIKEKVEDSSESGVSFSVTEEEQKRIESRNKILEKLMTTHENTDYIVEGGSVENSVDELVWAHRQTIDETVPTLPKRIVKMVTLGINIGGVLAGVAVLNMNGSGSLWSLLLMFGLILIISSVIWVVVKSKRRSMIFSRDSGANPSKKKKAIESIHIWLIGSSSAILASWCLLFSLPLRSWIFAGIITLLGLLLYITCGIRQSRLSALESRVPSRTGLQLSYGLDNLRRTMMTSYVNKLPTKTNFEVL